MAVQVELKRIIITETSDQQVIVLKESAGTREFPIVIGSMEAFAIDRRLKGQSTPRPQTHELLSTVIEKLDGKLERILINDMQDYTFFARLIIRSHNGKTPGVLTNKGKHVSKIGDNQKLDAQDVGMFNLNAVDL